MAWIKNRVSFLSRRVVACQHRKPCSSRRSSMELPEIALRLEGPNAGSSAKKWAAGRKKLETLFSLLGPISQRAAASRKKAEEAKQLCEMREKLLKNEYAAQKARTEKEKLLKKLKDIYDAHAEFIKNDSPNPLAPQKLTEMKEQS